jgi:hypothetical protein
MMLNWELRFAGAGRSQTGVWERGKRPPTQRFFYEGLLNEIEV